MGSLPSKRSSLKSTPPQKQIHTRKPTHPSRQGDKYMLFSVLRGALHSHSNSVAGRDLKTRFALFITWNTFKAASSGDALSKWNLSLQLILMALQRYTSSTSCLIWSTDVLCLFLCDCVHTQWKGQTAGWAPNTLHVVWRFDAYVTDT